MKLLILILVATACYGDIADDAKKHLQKYGYYNPWSFNGGTVEEALKKFQRTFHLNVTGVADEETKKLLNGKRCGMPDTSPNSFANGDARWIGKSSFTYSFDSFTPDLADEQTKRLTKKALGYWASVAPLTFTEVQSGGDIIISFGPYYHTDSRGQCPHPFDGRSGTLAHAFYPNQGSYSGRVHFDEDESFTENSYNGVDFLFVAIHEFGHTLGLRHDTSTRSSIMFPYARRYNGKDPEFGPNDISRIQGLYGKKSGNGGNTTKRPTTTRSSKRSTKSQTEPKPPSCKDARSSGWCRRYQSRCKNYSQGWTRYMNDNCYDTCNC